MHEVLCLDYSSSQMLSAGEWTDLITQGGYLKPRRSTSQREAKEIK